MLWTECNAQRHAQAKNLGSIPRSDNVRHPTLRPLQPATPPMALSTRSNHTPTRSSPRIRSKAMRNPLGIQNTTSKKICTTSGKIRKQNPYHKRWSIPPLADDLRSAIEQWPFHVHSVLDSRVVVRGKNQSKLELQYLVRFVDTLVPENLLACEDFPWRFADIVNFVDMGYRIDYLVRWEDSWLWSSDLIDAQEAVETFHTEQFTKGEVLPPR